MLKGAFPMLLWKALGLLCTCIASMIAVDQGCSVPATAFTQADIDALSNCTSLPTLTVGLRDCSVECGVTNLSSLRRLKTIAGDLTIQCCASLTALSGLDALTGVGGSLVLYFNQNLTTFGGLPMLTRVNRSVEISQNVQLATVSAFASLQTIGGSLLIANNPALTSVGGFAALQTIKGEELEAAGHALSVLYNTALTDLSGFAGLVNVTFGTVHIEGNTKLCFAGYPTWTGDSAYLPRLVDGDRGIDWRQKLKGPQWQFTWNISGIPTLVIQQNGISCAKTSCHSSCGNAGCLGPNDPNLCGSCVQIGTISTCDTTTSTTSTTSTTIPTAATSCTPTTVAAVLGVFFTLIAVELLLVACVYFGWRVLQKMKERGTGSFDVHAMSSMVTSDLSLVLNEERPTSPESTSEVVSKRAEVVKKTSGKGKETGVVMNGYISLEGTNGESLVDQSRTDPGQSEGKVKRKVTEKGKDTGVVMNSYKPLEDTDGEIQIGQSRSDPGHPLTKADLSEGKVKGKVTEKKMETGVIMNSYKPLEDTDGAQSQFSPGQSEKKFKSKATDKEKETGVVMNSYKPLQDNDQINRPGVNLRKPDTSSAKTVAKSERPVSRVAPPPPVAVQRGSMTEDGTKPSTLTKSDSKRRLSFLGDGIHTSMSEESLSELAAESYEIQMRFPRNQLKLVKQIGTAHFGQVHQGEARGLLSRNNKKLTVVLKQLKDNATSEERDEFIAPVEAMKSLRHPNVLQLLGMSTENSSIMVILEFCAHGSFKTFLIRYRSTPSVLKDDGRLIRMACEMAAGLTYLHSMNVAHNDFAVRNCMVTYHDQVKIGDYGLAREVFKEDYYSRSPDQLALPIRWMAPEQIVVEARNTLTSSAPTLAGNLWAFGISLWEVASFALWPYEEQSNEEVIVTLTKTKKCTLESPLAKDDPLRALYDIMKSCWVPAATRPSMPQVAKRLNDLKDSLSNDRPGATQTIKHGSSTLSLKENTMSAAASHMKATLQSFTSVPQLPTTDREGADDFDDFDLDPPDDPRNVENNDDFIMDPPLQEEQLPLPYPFEDPFPPPLEDMSDLDAFQEPNDDFILELPSDLPSRDHTGAVSNPHWEIEDEDTSM